MLLILGLSFKKITVAIDLIENRNTLVEWYDQYSLKNYHSEMHHILLWAGYGWIWLSPWSHSNMCYIPQNRCLHQITVCKGTSTWITKNLLEAICNQSQHILANENECMAAVYPLMVFEQAWYVSKLYYSCNSYFLIRQYYHEWYCSSSFAGVGVLYFLNVKKVTTLKQ